MQTGVIENNVKATASTKISSLFPYSASYHITKQRQLRTIAVTELLLCFVKLIPSLLTLEEQLVFEELYIFLNGSHIKFPSMGPLQHSAVAKLPSQGGPDTLSLPHGLPAPCPLWPNIQVPVVQRMDSTIH